MRTAATLSSRARWGLALLWYAVIFALSHVPGTDVDSTRSLLELLALGDLNTLFRMAAHSAVFGIQAVLVYTALQGGLQWDTADVLRAITITAALGLSDEAHQHFVPLRHGRLRDVGVDAVGGAAVLLLVLALRERLWPRADRPPANPLQP